MPTPPFDTFATTTPGLEELLGAELRRLGLDARVAEPGGVAFPATRDDLARALLWSRLANRITVRIASFRARTFPELERHAAKVGWDFVLDASVRAHFRVTSRKSALYVERGIAERLERAVAPITAAVRAPSAAEALEDDVTALPGVQRFVVRVLRDDFTISADASGALLHRRGYRLAVAKAPLRETLAAALLVASGWTPDVPLLDPFCGSGTIPIEAALMARRIAPGRQRRFAAERWKGMTEAFASARANAVVKELPDTPVRIVGHDRDAGAIAAAHANAARARVTPDVEFDRLALSATASEEASGWVITNPPYGARVGERRALRDLYAALGNTLRRQLPGWNLALLGADRGLDAQIGITLGELFRTTNGGIPVRGKSSRSEATGSPGRPNE